jgi:ferrous iron transport protein B
MATRTMERRRDRILAMMVVPLMTCSARLPVYTLIIGALFTADQRLGPFPVQGLLMVAMYLFSTATALAAAWVLSRTVRPLRAHRLPFVIELPPYRLPRLRDVGRMMWERSRLFLREAGTVILACTVVLWALLSFPRAAESPAHPAVPGQAAELQPPAPVPAAPATPGAPRGRGAPSTGAPQLGPAAAAAVPDQAAQPCPGMPDGCDAEAARAAAALRNSYGGRLGRLIEPLLAPLGFDWKIAVGIIGAFAAREVFVSTMGILYSAGDEVDENSDSLRQRLRDERRPDGGRLYTPLVGLSLMVFFALACQCMSTLAVVRRETGGYRWPLFLLGYMTVLAWTASFLLYQGGRLLGFE